MILPYPFSSDTHLRNAEIVTSKVMGTKYPHHPLESWEFITFDYGMPTAERIAKKITGQSFSIRPVGFKIGRTRSNVPSIDKKLAAEWIAKNVLQCLKSQKD